MVRAMVRKQQGGESMARKWYRSGLTKFVLMAATVLSAAAAAGCGIFLLMLLANTSYLAGGYGRTYAESQRFFDDVWTDFSCIVAGVRAQELLAEKTEDGGDRFIDLQPASDTKGTEPAQGTPGMRYKVSDLKKWARSGWKYQDGDKSIIVCQDPDGEYQYYPYGDFVRMFTEGELKFVTPDIDAEDPAYAENYTREILERLRNRSGMEASDGVHVIADKDGTIQYVDFWNYGGTLLEEKYVPEGTKGILEVVNESAVWNGRLSEALRTLEETLYQFAIAQDQVLSLEELREGNTNLAYLYVDIAARRVYTNREIYRDYRNYSESLAQMTREDGAYVLIGPVLAECRTSLDIDDIRPWQELAVGMEEKENVVIAVQVNTEFPIADAYRENAQEYDRCAKRIPPLLAVFCLLAFLFMVSAVWLTLTAGRQKGDDRIHLCAFDRCFTELVLAGIPAIWITAGGQFFYLWRSGGWEAAVAGTLMFAVSVSLSLPFYLSVVRRIKAKALWKTSLLCRVLMTVQKFAVLCACNFPEAVKATAALVGCFLLMVLLLGIFDRGVFLGVMLALCVAALVVWLRRAGGRKKILLGLQKIAEGELQHQISPEGLSGEQRTIAEYINRIGAGLDAAVEKSLKNERMQTELITNVSHDIKTPLTSIINYVDLLKRENFTDPKICEYIAILEKKAQRLKTLTEDIIEVSKASTGNITFHITDLDFRELGNQAIGEFKEKFEQRGLTLVTELPQKPVIIRADGQRLWRVLENIFQNAVKYAQEGTRVYAGLEEDGHTATFSIKNISAQPLNFSADELTERFIRGDVARNTEGSGLGLSIAKKLTELQEGTLRLHVDGDLFRVNVQFPLKDGTETTGTEVGMEPPEPGRDEAIESERG